MQIDNVADYFYLTQINSYNDLSEIGAQHLAAGLAKLTQLSRLKLNFG